jgi:hypothetical protein
MGMLYEYDGMYKENNMSKFEIEMVARRDRVNRLVDALAEFREVNPSYAYQAGFFESQLVSVTADDKNNTEDLIRMLRRAVASVQQPA